MTGALELEMVDENFVQEKSSKYMLMNAFNTHYMTNTSSNMFAFFFGALNFIAAVVFTVSSVLLMKLDWNTIHTERLIVRDTSPIKRSLYDGVEPETFALIAICLASVTWLVAFFSLSFISWTPTDDGATASSSKQQQYQHHHQLQQQQVNNEVQTPAVIDVASPKTLNDNIKYIDTISNDVTNKMKDDGVVSQQSVLPISPLSIVLQNDTARIPVAILGGTGLVGRALAAHLINHPTYRLGVVVGSPQTAGLTFGKIWEQKENELVNHYGKDIWTPMVIPKELIDFPIIAFEQLVDMKKSNKNLSTNEIVQLSSMFVLSAIAPRLGWMEDKLIETGFDVFSISPHGRLRKDVPLIVPEVNGPDVALAFSQKRGVENTETDANGNMVNSVSERPFGRLVKSPNCVSCGLSVVLAAVKKTFGLKEVSATTFQTLTGRGDDKYPKELVVGNVLPLNSTAEDTNHKIVHEVKRVVGNDFSVSVTAQRIFAQRGHFVDVRIKTRNRVNSIQEVADALNSFTPFKGTIYESLPDAPKHPIKVILDPMWPRPVDCVATAKDEQRNLESEKGMTVFVGQICIGPNEYEEIYDITLSLVVDNIARGAYGAALLCAEYYYAKQAEMDQE